VTWLRWDVETPQSDVVGYLATALNCGTAQALGHYFACCSGFGQHRPDGLVSEVTDATLEHWALWIGRKGRFATAFRARCVGEDGAIRGWWRNRAVIRKQENDRKKPDGRKGHHSAESPESTAEIPRGSRGGNETTTTTPSGSTNTKAVVIGETQAAQRIAVALNRGLGDNPRIRKAYNPVIAAAGTQVVVGWLALGIPVEFAEREVHRLAAAYTGEGQISSLSYCDKAVQKAWARSQSRSENGGAVHVGKPTTRIRRVDTDD
jgi:hypothetical protein